MNSKLNEQGPDRILLCSDEILEKAVRFTNMCVFFGDGLIMCDCQSGEGEGGGMGDGDGWVCGNGWGYGYGCGIG